MNSLHRILGPIAALFAYGISRTLGMPEQAAWMLGTLVWVGWWWITEALPLAVTSLLPFVLIPLGGIADFRSVSGALGDHIILLFMGAFMLAKAVEVSGVHRRMALKIVHLIGANDGKRIVISFMLGCPAHCSPMGIVQIPVARASLGRITARGGLAYGLMLPKKRNSSKRALLTRGPLRSSVRL